MKTADLTGALLDYWTGRALDKNVRIVPPGELINYIEIEESTCFALVDGYLDWYRPFNPSTVPDHGHWIIEEKKISLDRPTKHNPTWRAMTDNTACHAGSGNFQPIVIQQRGDTALQAATRCIVALVYGAEVPA